MESVQIRNSQELGNSILNFCYLAHSYTEQKKSGKAHVSQNIIWRHRAYATKKYEILRMLRVDDAKKQFEANAFQQDQVTNG